MKWFSFVRINYQLILTKYNFIMDTVIPFVGQIQAFAFNFVPRGWAQCSGQLLPISQNQELYSLIGVAYGGDGRTTFGLPDLRGRSMISDGTGPGLDSIRLGQRGGSISETLSKENLPAHNHNVLVGVNPVAGDESNPKLALASHAGAFSESTEAGNHLGGVTQENVGNNTPFNIRNPYLGVNVCIALQGVYPPRT